MAQFVPYTPASYVSHQPPPTAYAYSGVHGPGPTAVYGMVPPINGHTSPHIVPMGVYQQPMAQYMAAGAMHGPHVSTNWSPRTGSWSMHGSYGPKVVSPGVAGDPDHVQHARPLKALMKLVLPARQQAHSLVHYMSGC